MTVWERFQQEVKGKRVLVFGLGIQGGGVAAANTLVQAGAVMRATDQQPAKQLGEALTQLDHSIEGTYGEHRKSDIDWADIVLKNPAVPFTHPLIKQAQAAGKLVLTETAWALQYLRDQTIGVTGTRGKTTTSHLIAAILTASGQPTLLGGNIPQQPALSLLPKVTADTAVVLEISSFHLESSDRQQVSPRYAVVTNLYPDHLNRYTSLTEYAQAKAAIFAWQKAGDHAFYGKHHPWSDTLAKAIQPGVQAHVLTAADFAAAASYDTHLPGEHNRENMAFAIAVTQAWGIAEPLIRAAIANFTGVPFRLQTVGRVGKIEFINDTTATTPVALEKALDTMTEPFVLIVGGATKHLPLEANLLTKLREKPSAIIWLAGSGTDELQSALGLNNIRATTALPLAVSQALEQAKQNGATKILFSPGFTSFEFFRNEFDRGEQFNQAVQAYT